MAHSVWTGGSRHTGRAALPHKNIHFVVDELRKASDKGYTDTVKELRRQGKKVVGIGEKKAPKELRDACSEFFEIK